MPPPTPAERFATILRCLSFAIAGRSAWGDLSSALMALIVGRIRDVNQRVARLAARIGAGTYVPRRPGRRLGPAARRPRQRDPLPRRAGWLLKLLPEEGYRLQMAAHRAQLESLLRDPEMAALLAAAPAALRRPVRSLCRMLGTEPPAILALPATPRPPRQERLAKPPPPRPEPPKPSWWQEPPRRTRWPKGVPRRPRPA